MMTIIFMLITLAVFLFLTRGRFKTLLQTLGNESGAVQTSLDNTTVPFIKYGTTFVINGSIAQDAARTTDLLQNTVMAYNPTNQNWVPFNDLTQTNGESVPRGIYLGDDIDAADLVAGDIDDIAILVGGCCTVDQQLVVWDDSTLDEDDIVNPGTIEARSARQALRAAAGIWIEETVDISEFEN